MFPNFNIMDTALICMNVFCVQINFLRFNCCILFLSDTTSNNIKSKFQNFYPLNFHKAVFTYTIDILLHH